MQENKYIIHRTREHPSIYIMNSHNTKPLYQSPKNSYEVQLHLVDLDASNHLIVQYIPPIMSDESPNALSRFFFFLMPHLHILYRQELPWHFQ